MRQEPATTPSGIRVPTDATLRKYGLSVAQWADILGRQGGVCAICGKQPKSGRLNIDHEHVARGKRWRSLPPERKREHVRGLLCFLCNKYLVGRGVTLEKSRRAVSYLEEHDARKALKAVGGSEELRPFEPVTNHVMNEIYRECWSPFDSGGSWCGR